MNETRGPFVLGFFGVGCQLALVTALGSNSFSGNLLLLLTASYMKG